MERNPRLRPMFPALLVMLAASLASAGETVVEETPKGDEMAVTMTVTADRAASDVFDQPATIEAIGQTNLQDRRKITNFVDAFAETAAVTVQKTAQGQGSPFIRGFTGFQNLLMIDGIRFNNSIFRSGPNQYWATIDPLMSESIELLKGTGGSVLYGSDAIGGTANVLTRSADLSPTGNAFHGSLYYRYGDAEDSNLGRVELMGSHDGRLGFVLGASLKDFGDFTAGGDTGTVENSGYDEYGIDGRLDYLLSNEQHLTFVLQTFRQNDVPRTEQTIFAIPFKGTKVGSDLVRDHDQERLLSYGRYRINKASGPIEEAEFTLSFQQTDEERYRERTGGKFDRQGFDVDTYGVQAQLRSGTPLGRLTYGVEFYHDAVNSFNRILNADGSIKSESIQGPVADDATYDNLGLYVQDRVDFADELLSVTGGARFSHVSLDAGRVEDPATHDEISITDDWSSLVGSLRLLVRPDAKGGDHVHLFGSVAQAFRAPNLSDITTFDATSAIETPTRGLNPETYVGTEVGAKLRSKRAALTAAYFHTFLKDQIVQSPTGVFIDGVPEVQKTNQGDGYIRGLEFAGSVDVAPAVNLWANLSWMEGEVDQLQFNKDGTATEVRAPASRIVPVMSNWGLRFRPSEAAWWVEVHGTAYADADKLALRDVTDTRRIPPGGTPGFAVFGIRGAIRLLEDRITLAAGVENLGDEDYRIHGSGQNMPGRNAVVSAKYSF